MKNYCDKVFKHVGGRVWKNNHNNKIKPLVKESKEDNYFDEKWINYPMPIDYTCPCGIYVHPSCRNTEALHIKDCKYFIQKD